MHDEAEWRPGPVARSRALVRRVVRTVAGGRGEELLHAAYHAVLRRTGRFGPPEGPATSAMLAHVARRAQTIIDVGANVGLYSWYLRRRAQPAARLFALEPHPGTARMLRRTLGRLSNCVVLEVGAADRDGTASLIVPEGAFGSGVSGLSWIPGPDARDEPRGIPIRLRRIDGLVAEGSIQVRDPLFVKIDVEGGEPRVLRGAGELLRAHRPIIYFECQEASLARQGEVPGAVWSHLGALGYRVYAARADRFEPMEGIDPGVVNYLAIPDVPLGDADRPLDGPEVRAVIDRWAARSPSSPGPLPNAGPAAGAG